VVIQFNHGLQVVQRLHFVGRRHGGEVDVLILVKGSDE